MRKHIVEAVGRLTPVRNDQAQMARTGDEYIFSFEGDYASDQAHRAHIAEMASALALIEARARFGTQAGTKV
ncbi:MAG: hypothetical protein ACRDSE_12095, partial [Pseudonocardiaceae bacterium]